MASDGDNLAWRILPEFPKYEITSDGDIRNRLSGKQIFEHYNKKTGVWVYALHRGAGRSGTKTSRSMWGLIYSAFPELLVEWKPIPDFPLYMTHPDGRVMGISQHREIKPREHDGQYRLSHESGRRYWRQDKLPVGFWDEELKEAA